MQNLRSHGGRVELLGYRTDNESEIWRLDRVELKSYLALLLTSYMSLGTSLNCGFLMSSAKMLTVPTSWGCFWGRVKCPAQCLPHNEFILPSNNVKLCASGQRPRPHFTEDQAWQGMACLWGWLGASAWNLVVHSFALFYKWGARV